MVSVTLVAGLALLGCGEATTDPAPGPVPASSHASCDTTLVPGDSLTDAISKVAPKTTICLRAGTFVVDELLINKQLTLQSAPGGRATLRGRLYLAPGSDGSRILDLDLNGNGPVEYFTSPTIAADHVTFRNDDVTNDHTAICFSVGNATFGRTDGARIIGNSIHDCGSLPATNFEHGIYVADARNTLIRDNLIADNADRGVQLFPNAMGTRVIDNLIVGNGQGLVIGGNRKTATRGSRIEGNIIADSQLGANLASSFPQIGPVGRDNIVRDNCISVGTVSGIAGIGRQLGFSLTGNEPDAEIVPEHAPSPDQTPTQCRAALSAGTGAGSG
ncbi:hypothetical protein BH10ACT11_BH10ACT11_16010 [soil metagenome]